MAVQYAFGKIVTQGLDLNVDAADPTSYPGTGTTWTSVVNRSITGSLVSCSFSSDFKGGIVFNNPSASVEFPGTVANYGTGSFTIEMAFRPAQIEGIHYLVSKNSGSFPNWGVYLSGSGGSGKLYSEFQYTSAISASTTSSFDFITGSVYSIDIIASIQGGTSFYYKDGVLLNAGILFPGNTYTGSLGTGSFQLGTNRNNPFSGSIFTTKIYQTVLGTQNIEKNYAQPQGRFKLPPILPPVPVAINPDYQAVLNRATSLGYTLPTPFQQQIDNKLILDLKASGYWDKLGNFFVFAHPTSRQFATLNWKSPTTVLSIPGTFTYTPGVGFGGDGINNVNIPPVNGSRTDCSIIFYTPSSNQYFVRDGYSNSGNRLGNINTNQLYRGASITANLTGTGFKALGIANTSGYVYNNNVFTTTTVGTAGIIVDQTLVWGGGTNGANSSRSTGILSFFGQGTALITEGYDVNEALSFYLRYIS
jgi:hypothetical protein